MLSEQEMEEIRHELRNYDQRRGAAPEALMVVQQHRGWVSDEALRDVAEFLDMTVHELDSIATLYSLIYREPVGRHVILICDSVSCWVMGYNPLLDHLQETLGIGLGETTQDGRFTLLPTACLGACDRAPVMMVDEDLHDLLTAEKIDQLLAGYE
jgi:NADH-quinone oxidoreductase subunit E